MMGTDPFLWDRRSLSFSDPDPPFVIRSFADPDLYPRLHSHTPDPERIAHHCIHILYMIYTIISC